MLKQAAQAWALAAILLLPNYVDLTSSTGDARMRVPIPLTPIAAAHLTDIAIVTVVFFGLFALLRRLRIWPTLSWILMAALPTLLLARNVQLFPFHVPNAAVAGLGALWAGIILFFILRFPVFAARLRRFGSTFLAAFAIFALVMTAQLVRAAFWRPGPQSIATAIPAASPSRPRLVWIVFDELAYRPVFEARDQSLQLPNFDHLRAQSTLYSNVTPVASRTVKVISSLLLGRVINDYSYSAGNRFTLRSAGDPDSRLLDPGDTLFGMAHRRGLTTNIVGWYLPYCPTFSAVVTNCYWDNQDAQDRGPTSLNASYGQNVWFPLRILAEQIFVPRRAWSDIAAWNARGHMASVINLRQHALQAVETSQADILYLHLPAPHPPAVWNRRTNRFAWGGSYLDSLALTDAILGQILQRLQSQPRWAETTLIVQGDHSWRTWMWRSIPGWSQEDERVSHGGQWDPRPVLLVHTPGQQQPATVAVRTSEMLIHTLVATEIETIARSNQAAQAPSARKTVPHSR